MPILTATPQAPATFVQEAYWPSIAKDANFGPGFFAGINFDSWAYRTPFLGEPPVSGSSIMTQVGPGVGGGGVLKRLESSGGIPYAARYSSTGVTAADVVRPPYLVAGFDPGANSGALIGREDFRVCIFREVFRYTGGFGDGTCGRVWSWNIANVAGVDWAQGGSAIQQHGIYGNGAGGLEYRSFSAVPVLLETVAIPGVALGPWITADHQFISWAPGRAASYELRVNGSTIVQRDFGSALLPFPSAAGVRLQQVWRMTAIAGTFFMAYMYWRGGKFTLDGLELRA